MNVLHLTLKRQFFERIAGGRQPYEHRKVKEYWTKRLEGHQFDEVHFKNGYGRNAPFMRVEVKGITKITFMGEPSYEIHLGQILEVQNYDGPVVTGY
jgi:hypothetical protein